VIRAVVFDLDGVLLDSEGLWDRARRDVAAEHAGRFREDSTQAMQGMSSTEWSQYMRDRLGVDLPAERITELVVANLLENYQQGLPFLPGAPEAVRRLGATWPLAVASSSNRVVIDLVLAVSGLQNMFQATISSEQVPRGKPAPDVYLEAARLLGQPPGKCAAVEDSVNGILSALAAGMVVVAVPNRDYPPPDSVVSRAHLVVETLAELRVDALQSLGAERDDALEHRLDEEEVESFPASDPHSDWAGPPG
jgi:HAD superfamily hydrolase (TIGR01509 family)